MILSQTSSYFVGPLFIGVESSCPIRKMFAYRDLSRENSSVANTWWHGIGTSSFRSGTGCEEEVAHRSDLRQMRICGQKPNSSTQTPMCAGIPMTMKSGCYRLWQKLGLWMPSPETRSFRLWFAKTIRKSCAFYFLTSFKFTCNLGKECSP